MSKKYQVSSYAKRFDRDGQSALFHGLSMRKAYGEKEVINDALKKIKKPYTRKQNQSIDFLIDAGFFVQPREDEQRFSELKKQVGKIGIKNIVMIVDNRCNNACTYCQIEQNMNEEQGSQAMPIDVAKKALDLYERNSKGAKKRTINMTGGEPLLNFETVKYIVDRAQTMPNTRTDMFTNAQYVTKEMADYFAKARTLMIVSFDGPKDIHDSVRIKKNGTGTFDDVLRGYYMLKDAGCKVGISAVAGTHNIGRIDEVIELFKELDPPSIGLNFGHYLLSKENIEVITMEKFADALSEFYVEMRKAGIFVENISRYLNPFSGEEPRLNECQAQGRGFSVDSRGKIGVCKSLLVSDHLSKSIDEVNPDLSKEPMFKEWAMRSPFTLEECVSCSAVGICGGGCTYDAYVVNKGDITKIDKRLCDYTDKMVEFLTWDLFDGLNKSGRIKKEGIYIPSVEEQKAHFSGHLDPKNELQRSVGHETED